MGNPAEETYRRLNTTNNTLLSNTVNTVIMVFLSSGVRSNGGAAGRKVG